MAGHDKPSSLQRSIQSLSMGGQDPTVAFTTQQCRSMTQQLYEDFNANFLHYRPYSGQSHSCTLSECSTIYRES